MKRLSNINLLVVTLSFLSWNIISNDHIEKLTLITPDHSHGSYKPIQQNVIDRYDYALQLDGDKIYVYSNKLKDSPIILDGAEPSLSPDGKKLVYEETSYPRQNNMIHRISKVYIIDLISKVKEKIGTENNTNIWEPLWSPDGKYILYETWTGKNYSIGLYDLLNKTMVQQIQSSLDVWTFTWASSSKKILVNAPTSVFFIDLNGKIEKKSRFRKFFPLILWIVGQNSI